MSPDSTRPRILVVEDDEGARENLRDILELDDYAVETFDAAAPALASLHGQDVLAVILDRRLPDGRAEELLPRFNELAPGVAVIVVTGYADVDSAIAAMRLGAVDYLFKPINADLLRASVARVAERRRLGAELEEARRRAVQAQRLAAIGEVFTGLAHESRNALQRSQVALERLAKRVKDQPEALELIARAQRAQDYLHGLYEEVRNYAAPLTSLEKRPWHLARLLERTWEDLAVVREGRQAQLLQDGPAIDARCKVDARRMEQVFRNVLENALAACADPVEIRAHWSTTSLAGQPALQVAIRDNGPGLTAEARERIFDPFFTTKARGTGLGMAIAKRIVEAHGGRLSAGHANGVGAEIVVTLLSDAS